jgi:hypothetical protein
MKIYESMLSRLKNQHESIPEIISKTGEKLFVNPQPGKWSIHDNITHLAKYQPVFIERVNSILKNVEPGFERYTAETDPEFETWRKWETNNLISTLNSDRKKIVDLITKLSEEEIGRVGIHTRFGRLTILQWTEFFLLHEAHHMFTMFQLANTL